VVLVISMFIILVWFFSADVSKSSFKANLLEYKNHSLNNLDVYKENVVIIWWKMYKVTFTEIEDNSRSYKYD